MSNFLGRGIDFYPKDFIKQLQKLEDLDCSYTNESKVIAANYTAKLEANEIYRLYAA